MRLLFDLVCTQQTGYQGETLAGGGMEYAKSVFRELATGPLGKKITGFYKKNFPLDPEISELADRVGGLLPITSISELPTLIAGQKFDRIFSGEPAFMAGMNLGTIEFLGAMHDLRQLEVRYDEFELVFRHSTRDVVRYWAKRLMGNRIHERKRKMLRRLLSVSTRQKFIVATAHTRFAFLRYFPELKLEDLIVCSCAPTRAAPCAPIERLGYWDLHPRKFFLLISANRWTKNPVRAALALDEMFTAHPDIGHRVLVTGLDDKAIQMRIRRRIRNNDRFTFTGYVSRSELELLYREAYCFVYPTLNEGYGYPPVEAMKYGTPVIGAANTSIPEVYGDGILYFDAHSIHEMACRMLQIALDPAQWDIYSKRALATAQQVEAQQKKGLEQTVKTIMDPTLFQ